MKQEWKTPYRNPSPPHTHFPCPRHPKQELKKRETTTTYGRWSYYKCPVPDCFACAGVDNIQCCVASSQRMLNDYYIQLPVEEMKCDCQRPLIMSMSRSEKNPGKFYFRCSKRQCDIFQGANEYPQTKVRAWLAEGRKLWLEPHPLQPSVDRRDALGPFEGNWDRSDLSPRIKFNLHRLLRENTPQRFHDQYLFNEFTPKERLYLERRGLPPSIKDSP